MRGAIAWSYDLMSAEVQCLFRRLGVFVGGCSVEAVEAVCMAPAGTHPLGLDVLEGLGVLVDQSVLQRRVGEDDEDDEDSGSGGGARFGMLQVIREYALEQLEGSDGGREAEAEAVRRAHAVHYGAVAQQLDREWGAARWTWSAQERQRWSNWMDQDLDNFRAVLAWAKARADRVHADGVHANGGPSSPRGMESAMESAMEPAAEPPLELGLRLAGDLLWFWAMRGHLREGGEWLAELLALDGLDVCATTAETARIPLVGDLPPPTPRDGRLAEGMADGPHITTVAVRARALYTAGVLALWQSEFERAVPLLEQSLALYRAAGDKDAAGALNSLGMALMLQGGYAQAAARFEESLALDRALGNAHRSALTLCNLGYLALLNGNLTRAQERSEEALAASRHWAISTAAGAALGQQALIAWRRGQLRQAAVLAHESLLMHRAVGDMRHEVIGLETCAIICAAQGRVEQAARLLGAAQANRDQMGIGQLTGGGPTEADIKAALDEVAWTAAFTAGRALALEDAIAEALDQVSWIIHGPS